MSPSKSRRRVGDLSGSSESLRSPSGNLAPAAMRGVPLCMSCIAPVDWRYSETLRTWQPFDAGTKTPHRCKS